MAAALDCAEQAFTQADELGQRGATPPARWRLREAATGAVGHVAQALLESMEADGEGAGGYGDLLDDCGRVAGGQRRGRAGSAAKKAAAAVAAQREQIASRLRSLLASIVQRDLLEVMRRLGLWACVLAAARAHSSWLSAWRWSLKVTSACMHYAPVQRDSCTMLSRLAAVYLSTAP
jgi:hypothetical protein